MIGIKDLSKHDVRCIRHWRENGMSIRELAAHFHIDESHVYCIVRNKSHHDPDYTPVAPHETTVTPQQREHLTRELRYARRMMQAAANSKMYGEADYWLNCVQVYELALDRPVPSEVGV